MNKVTIELETGARPSESEMEVVDILVKHGIPKEHVLFRKPIRSKGTRTSDLLIDGVEWEIKSLERLGKYTIDHALRAGLRQADNIVVDLRKLSKALEDKALVKLKREFCLVKSWRGLIIVVRFNGEILTYKK